MHTLENKILIFAFQEFVYPEIIQMDQVALGICKIWSLVDFSLCNYFNFASFDFCNYLLVEIKRWCIVSILHFLVLGIGFWVLPFSYTLFSKVTAIYIQYYRLEWLYCSIFIQTRVSWNIFYHMTEAREGTTTWQSSSHMPTLITVHKQLTRFHFNYSINWFELWLTISRIWAVLLAQKPILFLLFHSVQAICWIITQYKAWTFKCQLLTTYY